MPYKSLAQAAKFHSLLRQGKISKKVVDEFDRTSEGMKLPLRIKKLNCPTCKGTGKVKRGTY